MIKNKKILVTGAGGFVASHLARELYAQGNFVRVADIKWDGYIDEPYYSEKLTLDLRDSKNCLTATKGMDYVFNLAANMGGIGFITEVCADIVYDNTLINANMAKSCVENKINRVFFSSSACIYPTFKQETPDVKPLKEEDAYPADPDSFYGWEKLYAEKIFQAFKRDYKLDIRIARFHNIYGPEGTYEGGREKSPAALCKKVADANNPGEIEIWGDGDQTRSYCYIDDCVKGCILLMESDHIEPLNIGSDRLISINKLADMIIAISGKKISKKHNLSAPQGVRGRNSDNTRLRQILGWEPQITYEKGLVITYNWIKNRTSKKEAVKSKN
ncbi:MAG: NAD-dependent epimerase/dehydratase family protein [Candidatus Omnitrophota bacterium]